MNFDLWTLLVDYTFGSFWVAAIALALLIWIIIGVYGRMSRLTQIHYLILFGMTMTIGYGYRWLTAIMGFALLFWMYRAIQNNTGG